MGQLKKGLLGPVNGKVGTIVGASWNGIDYVRSLPTRSKNTVLSPAQEGQHAKFAMSSAFVRAMKTIIGITFKKAAKKMSGVNAASADFLKKAITGSYPNLSIDFAAVQLSYDSGLANGGAPFAASNAPGVVNFSWTDNTGIDASASDKAIVVAYSETSNKAVYNTAAGQRSDASATLPVPGYAGQTLHTWIIFISEDYKRASATHYTGMVTVQ